MTASPKKIIVLKYGMALVPSQTYDVTESNIHVESVVVHLSEHERVNIHKNLLNFNPVPHK